MRKEVLKGNDKGESVTIQSKTLDKTEIALS